MIGKFYNKMPFTINMRKTWEPGSPAIRLESGSFIEGPADILSQFKFLVQLPSDFCTVESSTPTNQVAEKQVVEETPPTVPEQTVVNETVASTPTTPSNLPFDPQNVNWLHIKLADLEVACKVLNIDISNLSALKPKQKKWELVKLIKAHCGINKA